MKRQFQTFNFSIRNTSSDSIDIYIDGQIVDAETQQIYRDWFGDDTSVSFKSFREQLNAVEARTYNVYINSPGGVVTDAMAIHDLLVDLQSKGKTVNTIGRGIIASAATYILMAGKNSEMSANSWFMIHNVSGYAWGDVNEVENMAATLRKFNNAVRDYYANATGKRKEDITKMMDAETWMTANEAKEYGFVKQVSGDAKFTNVIPKENWQFSNTAVLNAYNSAVEGGKPNEATTFQNQIEDMKKFFADLGNQILNAVKGVKAPENNDHQSLINSISEAVSKPFTDAGEQMEAAISEIVNAAVKTAVENTTKDISQKVANLETVNTELKKANEDFEKEISNLKGNKSTARNEDGGTTPIGKFNK